MDFLLKPWHIIAFAVLAFFFFFWMGRKKHGEFEN